MGIASWRGMTQDDVRTLIRRIELKTWPIERWRHDEHVAMLVWYLTYLPRGQALRVICNRIAAYQGAARVAALGRRGYHETLTVFVAQGVGAFLEALPEELGLEERVRRAQDAFRDVDAMIGRFYEASTIDTFKARRRWVAPDRSPMHEWLRACAALAEASEAAPRQLRLAGARG